MMEVLHMKKMFIIAVAFLSFTAYKVYADPYKVDHFVVHDVKSGDTWTSILSEYNGGVSYSAELGKELSALNPTVKHLDAGEKVQVPVFK
jgi:hypothetical protein